ncbi:MAG: phosphatase PAP2 family protein [Rhizomicrobium sp.]|nr:phosphatase PAP2 family protein [Rhizomicrobium sp.]
MIELSRGARIWLLSLFACALSLPVIFAYVDIPAAHLAQRLSGHLGALQDGIGSAVLLTLEALALLAVALHRIVRGRVSRLEKVLAVALLSSVCAYAVNSSVLKILWGVPNVGDVLAGAPHSFNLFLGTPNSSFPSGHMMLAGGFAGVFLRFYRASVLPLAALLLFGAGVLVLGGWHFVSDVVVGGFLGISAGLLAGEVWLEHESRNSGM